MRQSCTAAVVLSIVSLSIGCQQAPNASSSTLTPVGTLSQPQLAPVSANSTGIGPFGSPTRIPPPATGSYAVPNNYMGGTTATGQVGLNTQPDAFGGTTGVAAAGFTGAPRPGGVAATSFGSGFPAPQVPSNSIPPSPTQSQYGGMPVHDLTGAPPPPGYQGNAPSMVPGQPAGNPVPGSFTPNAFPNTQPPLNPAPPVQGANAIPGADIAGNGQPAVSIAQTPTASGFSSETPIQPSPLQPTFQGASQFQAQPPSTQFQAQPPSTDPVNNGGQTQSPDLLWRRPTAAY